MSETERNGVERMAKQVGEWSERIERSEMIKRSDPACALALASNTIYYTTFLARGWGMFQRRNWRIRNDIYRKSTARLASFNIEEFTGDSF